MNLTKSTAIGHVQAGWVDKGAVEINAMVWMWEQMELAKAQQAKRVAGCTLI